MKAYLDIVKDVLENGVEKVPVRKDTNGVFHPVDGGVKTIGLTNVFFKHDMSKGFPLLTTKKMGMRNIAVELEGFIKGITSKKWYKERKCNIWNEWANPLVVKEKIGDIAENQGDSDLLTDWQLRKQIQEQEDDLGPIYGYQWRHFGEVYDENDSGPLHGYDQLKSIVETLENNYNDRRMVCSAWNPNHLSRMGLPACHVLWNVTALGDTLNLHWHQRSCDLMYGVPYNIASYGLLLELLSAHAGLKPGILSGMLMDCHIYDRQLESAKEQITREPKELPMLELYYNGSKFNIWNWTHKDIELTGYEPHPKLSFGDVVV